MIKEDGSEEWIFESVDQRKNTFLCLNTIGEQNAADSRVFWFTNYATPVIWVILMIVNVLSFSLSNAAVCIFAFGLASFNLLGFIRCEKNHKQKVQGFLMDQAQKNLTPEQIFGIGKFAVEKGLIGGGGGGAGQGVSGARG
jgi:hypothetical protein